MTTSTTPCCSAGDTTSRVPTPCWTETGSPGAAGRLGVDLGQDLVLGEVVGGEPDRAAVAEAAGAGAPEPHALDREEQQHGNEPARSRSHGALLPGRGCERGQP